MQHWLMEAACAEALPISPRGDFRGWVTRIGVEYVRVIFTGSEDPLWQRNCTCITHIGAGSMERHDCLHF